LILATLDITKPPPIRQKVCVWKLKSIDKEKFKQEMLSTRQNLCLPNDTINAYNVFNETVTKVLDMHAPLKEKTITIRPKVPWYNSDIADARREKRKAERKWRATGLEVHREIFKTLRNKLSHTIRSTKANFYKKQVEECDGDQKKLFRVVDDLMHQKQAPALPSYSSADKLAEAFGEFFVSKIVKIRTKIDEQTSNDPVVNHSAITSTDNLRVLDPATDTEILKVIRSAKSSSCQLDPIPTSLLKDCVEQLVPAITVLINLSLSSGIVPPCLKHAVIRPLLKKKHLDHENFKNYRPVSNLPFMSKILEKVVAKRLLDHMEKHNLHEVMQSAYKKLHSTETALVRVQNDILNHLDDKNGVILVLLDLSASFDTIDHDTLFHQLHHRLGLSDTALQWFKSYLSGRTQSVCIENASSKPTPLRFGVPQGSVLGPLLYTIYTLPLGDILREAGISYHLYADDTQLYLSFNVKDLSSQQACLEKMEQCVSKIKSWMTYNKLKLNDEKTEVVFISSRYFHESIDLNGFAVDSVIIEPSTSARNIGVIFDNMMTMKDQVTAICKSSHFHLRNIGRIRKCITYEACEKVIHAFVSSRLDCCNATLYGLPDYQYNRLQRILHIAARILTLTPPSQDIIPILKELHWLPIEQRVEYKIILLTFKALHDLAPLYLQELLKPYPTPRPLRSGDDEYLLDTPKSRTKTFGGRAFSHAAPKLWNGLPEDIRSICKLGPFKKELKTILFTSAYD